MKNIHLIETDKPSKLYKIKDKFYIEEYPDKTVNVGNQNIYITNSEEIKQGDWFIGFTNKLGQCTSKNMKHNLSSKGLNWDGKAKKIILTTDLDLVKDGVQAVDDSFLEWFVKNSNCEKVKVIWQTTSICKRVYKIIIPKEELKQEYKPNSCNIIFKTVSLIEPKQETSLEEAAENYSKITLNRNGLMSNKQVNSFIAGANYQTNNILEQLEMHILINEHDWNRNPQAQLKDFIKQIK